MRRDRQNEENKKKKSVLKTTVIVFLVIVIILVVLGAAAFGAGYYYIHSKLDKVQQVEINEEELDIAQEVEEQLEEYRNIALFGVDSRSGSYGKGNRSDCIIIASINNKTKEVRLVSVYRDTYVQIKGVGLDKITHAYSYGEAPLALSTLNTNLDLNIKEFVTVNFDAVAEAVDDLGGIRMDITSAETKYINVYIDEINRVTGRNSSHITQAGTYILDGTQAVAYGRIRYTAGGDYKRTERMRDVVVAMFEKLKTKSVFEMNSLLDKILPKIYTNISTSEMISMMPDVMNYKVTKSIGWPYEVRGYTGAAWYGVPVTLESNVRKLHEELFDDEEYTVSDTVKNTSNKIISTTGYKN